MGGDIDVPNPKISNVNGRWGSVLSKYGQRVVICEAHGSAGGAAHGFSCKLPKEGGTILYFWSNILLLLLLLWLWLI